MFTWRVGNLTLLLPCSKQSLGVKIFEWTASGLERAGLPLPPLRNDAATFNKPSEIFGPDSVGAKDLEGRQFAGVDEVANCSIGHPQSGGSLMDREERIGHLEKPLGRLMLWIGV